MCQHGDANSSTNWRYRRVPFNESAWECWGLKKTYILREIPKTRFMDSGLLYENDEEECVLWMRSAWQTLASLCLFTCIVYVSKYWVPIALLRQNKPIWLLYLGHAQIIKEFSASKMKLMCSFPFPSMRQLINVTKNFRRDLHVKHKKSRVMTSLSHFKIARCTFFSRETRSANTKHYPELISRKWSLPRNVSCFLGSTDTDNQYYKTFNTLFLFS